jgi:uncharacterized membrane protein YbhN (UPF0104 family)
VTVFGLFPTGWHWPVAVAAVIGALAIICVVAAGKSESEWLGNNRERLKLVAWISVGIVVVAIAATQLHKLRGMLHEIQDGDPLWLMAAVGVEGMSFVGYVVLTKEVFGPEAPRLGWPAAIEVTFGGVVATRLFSAAGAGGIAFTAWALKAAGMAARRSAELIAAFLAIMYFPYVLACLFGGLGGGAPAAVVWTGVALALIALAGAAAVTLVPGDLERRARKHAAGHGRGAKLAARTAAIPEIAGRAAREALALLRKQPTLLAWAILWWAADVATLYLCFRAFGTAPALGVLILGYFLGHIGNLVPLPGGIGGVETGMVGVFVACGMSLSEAIVGTIAYQLISTWLPVFPGLGAYWSLRRRIARWREEDGVGEDGGAPSFRGAPQPALDR